MLMAVVHRDKMTYLAWGSCRREDLDLVGDWFLPGDVGPGGLARLRGAWRSCQVTMGVGLNLVP